MHDTSKLSFARKLNRCRAVLASILLFRSRLWRRIVYYGKFGKQAHGHLISCFAGIATTESGRMDYDLARLAGMAASAPCTVNDANRLLRHDRPV
jgi:hypothetical protein